MTRIAFIPLIVAIALSGCAGIDHAHSTEGSVPPQLKLRSNGTPIWVHAGSFGPIHSGDEQHAQAVCAKLETSKQEFVARGYHSKALDSEGVPYPQGGYYCVARNKKIVK